MERRPAGRPRWPAAGRLRGGRNSVTSRAMRTASGTAMTQGDGAGQERAVDEGPGAVDRRTLGDQRWPVTKPTTPKRSKTGQAVWTLCRTMSADEAMVAAVAAAAMRRKTRSPSSRRRRVRSRPGVPARLRRSACSCGWPSCLHENEVGRRSGGRPERRLPLSGMRARAAAALPPSSGTSRPPRPGPAGSAGSSRSRAARCRSGPRGCAHHRKSTRALARSWLFRTFDRSLYTMSQVEPVIG